MFANTSDTMSPDRSKSTGSKEDQIVAVMGPTGAGKSTFIQHATGQNDQNIGHGLQSCTSNIRTINTFHPTTGCPMVFVDTPGFDDTYMSDMEILATIAEWLVKTYKKVNLTTIIYLHKISDNRATGSVLKNLEVFREMCGQKAMPNVVMATTMWSKVSEEEGRRREEELTEKFWNDLVANGCKVERFEDTHKSAWNIVDGLAGSSRAEVLLPQEIVDNRLRLNETKAGVVLTKVLKKLIKDRKDAARRLSKLAKQNQDNTQVRKELHEIEEKIRDIVKRLNEMRVPFTRKMWIFLMGKNYIPRSLQDIG
ncbi:hypothetical protein PILCRDRAFT_13215 [Piloderma croceum F 1598]|uniref:G domain-containing protein n=1 Tax=Piloderma croceum (strain F 1598) TaxID=765440 RepID=A0A0C3BET0_PILCF|nr:hypothetical protein PILCRDRAFT_13215 [Piloderma croceum F 1598]